MNLLHRALFARTQARRHVFARNLDLLLRLLGRTRKQAADEAGVPYQWLRERATAGLERAGAWNVNHLRRLARWLGLNDYRALWENELIRWAVNPAHRSGRPLGSAGGPLP